MASSVGSLSETTFSGVLGTRTERPVASVIRRVADEAPAVVSPLSFPSPQPLRSRAPVTTVTAAVRTALRADRVEGMRVKLLAERGS